MGLLRCVQITWQTTKSGKSTAWLKSITMIGLQKRSIWTKEIMIMVLAKCLKLLVFFSVVQYSNILKDLLV